MNSDPKPSYSKGDGETTWSWGFVWVPPDDLAGWGRHGRLGCFLLSPTVFQSSSSCHSGHWPGGSRWWCERWGWGQSIHFFNMKCLLLFWYFMIKFKTEILHSLTLIVFCKSFKRSKHIWLKHKSEDPILQQTTCISNPDRRLKIKWNHIHK